MRNELKAKMERGESAVGTFLELGSTSVVECLAISGFDYIIIDTEHGPFETESVMEYISAAKGKKMMPLVRIKEISRAAVLKNLDVGAMGLIIPNVRTMEDVRKIVNYGKYYPLGQRGVAYGRGCGYGMEKEQTMEEYFTECNRETMLIPQCETVECLEQIEEIVKAPGVDGIFIGPYDLSTAMGIPGQFSDPRLIRAVERIHRACKDAGKPCFIYADSVEKGKKYLEQKFETITLSMDAILMIQGMKKILSEVR